MTDERNRDENPRKGWGTTEVPPPLRGLVPPTAPRALRRRVLTAAEAELEATEASVAASAARRLPVFPLLVDRVFGSRVFWLAWSATLLLLLLAPAEPDPGETPAPVAPAELHSLQWKSGPTVDELRRRRDHLTTEGLFDHEP